MEFERDGEKELIRLSLQNGNTNMKEPLKMKAGEKIPIAFEVDLDGSENFRDWALVAQGDEGGESLILTPVDPTMKSD